MQVSVSGIHIDVGESLRQYVEKSIRTFSEHHKVEPVDVHVLVSKDNVHFRCDISLHLGRDVTVRGHEFGADAYMAIDNTVNHLTHRLRRHKSRLVTHHRRRQHEAKEQVLQMLASQYIVSPEEKEGVDAPVIIAETSAEIPKLSVSEAVMRLDLSNEPVIIFRSDAHGDLNAVYRRTDGNIGWVDPKQAK